MKLILGKPIVVGQGPTLEEADWGPWQFPQLLKREDGTLFASVNLGPDNWASNGDTQWFKSIGLRSNLDGKHPDGSRKRISESKKRRRLYGKGQRRRRC